MTYLKPMLKPKLHIRRKRLVDQAEYEDPREKAEPAQWTHSACHERFVWKMKSTQAQ